MAYIRKQRCGGETVDGGRLSARRFAPPFSTVRRKRKLSVPVSMMLARSVIRSGSALQSRVFGITWVRSDNGRQVVRYPRMAGFSRSRWDEESGLLHAFRSDLRPFQTLATPLSPDELLKNLRS